MTSPQEPNNHGQPTRIQGSINPQILGGGLLALVALVGYLVDIKDLLGHFGIKVPGPPTEYGPPEWIGTRIEYIYTKQLPNYKPQTTLVQTDKPANGDYAVLRNVDQDLSKIKRGRKNNSGNYEVSIRRTLQDKTPVCLEIYGQRLPEKSEFKNIIQINSWPKDKNYDKLTSEERDEECKKNKDFPLTIIVAPKP